MKKFTDKINENLEGDTKNYMFFNNLDTIKRLTDRLLEMNKSEIDNILNEHDWASDHISVSTENLEQVFNFLMSTNKDTEQ